MHIVLTAIAHLAPMPIASPPAREPFGPHVIRIEEPKGPDTAAVPEPTTLALVGSGLLGFVLLRRRRASRNSE